MGSRRYDVVVIDDDPSIGVFLGLAMRLDGRLELVEYFTDAASAIAHLQTSCPHAIMCDVRMPGIGGLEALPDLRAACPRSVIAMYTSEPEGAQSALEMGADEVFDKTGEPTELIERLVELVARRAGSQSA